MFVLDVVFEVNTDAPSLSAVKHTLVGAVVV